MRAAVSFCAAIVVLLTLLQPLLCVAHCALETRGALQAGRHALPDGPFLCHLAVPAGADVSIIPAFWPAALPALIGLVAASLLVLRLTIVAPSPLRARPCSPPIPPPRAA